MKSLIVEPLQLPFASFFGLNILLKNRFSNTLNLRSSLKIRDHASEQYSIIGNIISHDKVIAPHGRSILKRQFISATAERRTMLVN